MSKIARFPLFVSNKLLGSYRHELFQLLPPAPDDPSIDLLHSDHGGTLELSIDSDLPPEREVDLWAHDHRERNRMDKLRRAAAQSKVDFEAQLEADKQERRQVRPRAIAHEVVRLLSVISHYTFRLAPTAGEQRWVWSEDLRPEFRRLAYPSLRTGDADRLSTTDDRLLPVIPWNEYFSRLPGDARFHDVQFPDNLDEFIAVYLSLPQGRKLAVAGAMDLLGHARENESASLRLAAAVFALDGLLHCDDPPPNRCPACQNLLSEETCEQCKGPRFGLTRRFREFVEAHGGHPKVANRLYEARSLLAHEGRLLRADTFDTFFSTGSNDDELLFLFTTDLTRSVILNWLATTDPGEN